MSDRADLPAARPRARPARVEVLPPADPPERVAIDYVRTDESWDPARRTWQVSRSTVRILLPLQRLGSLQPARLTLAAAPRSLKLVWAAAGLTFATALALLLSLPSGRQAPPGTAGSSVDIALDPAPPAPLPVAAAPETAAAVVKPPVLPVAAPPAEPAAPPPAAPAAPEPAALDTLEAVKGAFAKALDSGSAERWEEAGLSGYVIVGPPAVAGEEVCRNVAVWLDRKGGTGQVVDGEKCLTADGQWVDAQPAPPAEPQ